jgi:hypothetical protein
MKSITFACVSVCDLQDLGFHYLVVCLNTAQFVNLGGLFESPRIDINL